MFYEIFNNLFFETLAGSRCISPFSDSLNNFLKTRKLFDHIVTLKHI